MSFEITVRCLIGCDNQHMISEVESSVKLFSNRGGAEEMQGEGRRGKMLAETFPLARTEKNCNPGLSADEAFKQIWKSD